MSYAIILTKKVALKMHLLQVLTYDLVVLKPPFFFPLVYPLCPRDSQNGEHTKPAVDFRGKRSHPIFFLQT